MNMPFLRPQFTDCRDIWADTKTKIFQTTHTDAAVSLDKPDSYFGTQRLTETAWSSFIRNRDLAHKDILASSEIQSH